MPSVYLKVMNKEKPLDALADILARHADHTHFFATNGSYEAEYFGRFTTLKETDQWTLLELHPYVSKNNPQAPYHTLPDARDAARDYLKARGYATKLVDLEGLIDNH